MENTTFEFNENRWVFMSHSTKDFDRVRLVRNALEESGFRPILFYLKSLTDENEINDLLKREIDARKRFILCDSPNARRSKYVRSEVDYILSKNRMYEKVDLSQIDLGGADEQESVLRLIKPFDIRTKVFISYATKDAPVAEAVVKSLEDEGFTCFYDKRDLEAGVSFKDQIYEAIESTLDNGYLLSLISRNMIRSEFAIEELRIAMKINMLRVFPVIIDDVSWESIPGFLIRSIQCMKLGNLKTSEKKAQAIVKEFVRFDLGRQKNISQDED